MALADFSNFISPHTLLHSPPNPFSGPSHQVCLRTFAPAAPSTGPPFSWVAASFQPARFQQKHFSRNTSPSEAFPDHPLTKEIPPHVTLHSLLFHLPMFVYLLSSSPSKKKYLLNAISPCSVQAPDPILFQKRLHE